MDEPPGPPSAHLPARHLEDDLHGSTDFAWRQLRLTVPEATRRLLTGAALGAAMTALALLGTGLVILASLTVDPQEDVLLIFDWPPFPLLLKGAFPSWAPRWEYAEVCAAYLPAGWLLSQLFRLRQRDIPAVQGRWSWNRNSLCSGSGNETSPQYRAVGPGTATPFCWGW
ncbi:hypothetical protein ACIG54_36305 [Streptomyces achromogenes]|uniref:hypothetical protein n=1 Tax=Streptomyces achromogenes TaxID=67255 RepID=UPI0037D2E351